MAGAVGGLVLFNDNPVSLAPQNHCMPRVCLLGALLLCAPSLFCQHEKHLKNIRQLTRGGDNAEAYFSVDGRFASFQSNNAAWGVRCDQIFNLDINKAATDSLYRPPMISTGKGRTTCSYYLKDGKHILYASTHEDDSLCPPVTHVPGKYLWAVYSSFDIYVADLSGKIVRKLTDSPGYDAEATVSPKGDKIVFTSTRSGDLELWTMNIDGSDQRQVTNGLGYDGGAFFSPDGKRLVFRASRPGTDEEKKEYTDLLKQGLVAPTAMEIYTCKVDGSDLRQVTSLGKANWAPFYHPSGKKIIFSSNHHSKKGYDFQLFMIGSDGNGLEQVTDQSIFNAFPMFSRDGKKLIFSSNRQNRGTRDTNLFIADWTD
jgi:TolB protein